MPASEKPKARDMDEPVSIPLDPEVALKALLKVDPDERAVREWIVDIMAADESGDYPGVGDPKARRMHWTGPAADKDAAEATAWAAWHEKYGPDKPRGAVTGTKKPPPA